MSGAILVTGATGTVGSATLAALSDPDAGGSPGGRAVRAGVRDPESDRDRLFDPLPPADRDASAVELVEFDFERPETWGPAFEGVERLFLTRPPSVSTDRIGEAVAAAARVGVERVVYLSVLGAERNPLLPHHRIESAIRDCSVEYTFLRASFFMQNLAEVHREEIRDRGEIFVPAGDGETSFVDARDLGAVAALALADEGSEHADRAYDLTGSEATTYHEVARVLADELGRPVEYAAPGLVRFLRGSVARGRPLPFALVMSVLYTVARLGLSGRVTDDTRRLLGREPIGLREFVADYRDRWVREEAAAATAD
jgi:uncharacterized protein YbjT (DUF2867 family)